MIWIIVTALILIVLYGPSLWAASVLSRNKKQEYFSGNGFEFARLLLDDLGMNEVMVEESPAGDHFDPITGTIRLSQSNCGNRSLTAIVVAAHEIGHAIQKKEGYPPLMISTRLALAGIHAERAGGLLIIAAPIIASILRLPSAAIMVGLGGFLALGFPLIVHLLTLPVEINASFGRALPILKQGKWIPEDDLPEAKKILIACALTYVAAALSGLLNFWRWIRFGR